MRLINYILLILLIALPIMADSAEIELIRLKYADPGSVAHSINALFAGRVNAIPVPSVNGVAINASDKSDMAEVAKLAAVLDRRPAMLRFTVKTDSRGHESSQIIGYNQRIKAKTTRQTTTSLNQFSVVALEFGKAQLTDELVQIYSLPGWYGPEIVVMTTAHGIKISGHLIDDERVLVQVWYAQDRDGASELLLTEVETRVSEWFSLGGLSQNSKDSGKNLQVGNNMGLAHRKTGGQIDRRFTIRVDMVR